ncbi:MAG: archaellin/type IV pilin N-terminal domain-containing protein [Candidatus Bathyarchaeia archaeon]|jgi:flagellin-like protein
MNYPEKIRKIQNNTKALSPVVASIILIAVTVAVSVAVAMWMGGLAGGFMESAETLQVDTQTFALAAGEDTGSITVVVRNTGTTPVTISSVKINGVSATTIDPAVPVTLTANEDETFTVEASSIDIEAGNNYQVTFITSKNNAFSSTAVAH